MGAWSIIHVTPSPSHLQRRGGGAESSKLRIVAHLPGDLPRPEAARRAPAVASLEQRMPVTQEIYQDTSELCVGNQRQRPQYASHYATCLS